MHGLFIDSRIERRSERRAAGTVGHRDMAQRCVVDLVQMGGEPGLHPPCHDQAEHQHHHIEHVGADKTHQHAGQHRADAGTDAEGQQQHRGERDPLLCIDVVVGQRDSQRIEAELQCADRETGREQQPHRRLGEHREGQRDKRQKRSAATDQPDPVTSVRQPAERPLHQQPRKNAAPHEEADLLVGQAHARAVERPQTIERADQQARHGDGDQRQWDPAEEKRSSGAAGCKGAGWSLWVSATGTRHSEKHSATSINSSGPRPGCATSTSWPRINPR